MNLGRKAGGIRRLAALLFLWTASPAVHAQQVQSATPVPPDVKTASPDGVNMKSGYYSPNETELVIGDPAAGGFSVSRTFDLKNIPASSKAFTTNWDYELAYRPNVPAAVYLFTIESMSVGVTFQRIAASTTYTDLSLGANSNRTLTRYASGSNFYFIYQEDGGKAIRFLPSSTGAGKVERITHANGIAYDFTYDLSNTRLRRVTSNAGYQLIYEYTSASSELVSKICAINLSVATPPASPACPVGVQSISYTYDGTGKRVTSTTDTAGATETASTTFSAFGTPFTESFRRPGETQPWLTNNYVLDTGFNARLHVGQQTFGDGRTVAYNFGNAGTGEIQQTTLLGLGWTENGTASTSLEWDTYQANAGRKPAITPTPTKVTDPLGRAVSTTYSGDWQRILNQKQPLGQRLTLGYDVNGNIAQQKLDEPSLNPATALITGYTYNCTVALNCDKPATKTDPRGAVTDFTYDPTHGGLLTATLPAPTSGAVRPQTRYTWGQYYAWYRNSAGTLVQAAAPIWLVNAISECRTLASCAGTADETRTSFVYGTPGTANNLLVTQKTVAAGDGSINATTSLTYDANGDKLTEDGPLPGNADLTRWRYDVMRRVVGVIGADPDGAGPRLHKATRNTYDLAGRLTKAESGTVNSQSDSDWAAFAPAESVEYQYDIMSRKTRQIVKGGATVYGVTQYSYDSFGRPHCTAVRMDPAVWLTQTDACVPQTTGSNGPDRITRNSYDLAGQLLHVEEGVGTAVAANAVVNSYTNNGKVATVKDGENNLTTYSYDGHDRLVKTSYPVAIQGANTSSTTDYEELTLDANGNVTSRRLRDGQSIGYGFDNLNRVTSIDLPNTVFEVHDKGFGYDLLGNRTSATMTNGWNHSFAYDALGRQVQENAPMGNVARSFDAAGRMVSETLPGGGLTVNYDYDVTGNMVAVRENGATSGVGVLATYNYDNLGRRTSVVFGNGSVQMFAYDAVSRLSGLANDLGGGATAHDLAQNFTWNPAGQIASVIRNNDSYAWQAHYNVDRGYSINGLNQMTTSGPATLGYDGRGNLITSGSNSFTYGPGNMLATSNVGGTSRHLAYEAVGRLSLIMGDATNSVRFDYSGSRLISERDWNANLLRRYVHGAGSDAPIVWYEGSGTSDRRFLMADERGSVVSITDSAGATININSYDEYGIPAPGNIGRFGYTGQTWLPELGMWYYKARIYSPTLGRFLQTDPIGYEDQVNLYAYVGNDPINWIDDTGERGRPVRAYQSLATIQASAQVTVTQREMRIAIPGYRIRPSISSRNPSTRAYQNQEATMRADYQALSIIGFGSFGNQSRIGEGFGNPNRAVGQIQQAFGGVTFQRVSSPGTYNFNGGTGGLQAAESFAQSLGGTQIRSTGTGGGVYSLSGLPAGTTGTVSTYQSDGGYARATVTLRTSVTEIGSRLPRKVTNEFKVRFDD